MNREQIMRMAQEAGFSAKQSEIYFDRMLQRFAVLVAAQEREACAKVCENIGDYDENVDEYYSDIYADAIRARSAP